MDKIANSATNCNTTIYTKNFNIQGKQKAIKIINADLADIEGQFDIIVCSAYKNDYIPVSWTVIGKLNRIGIDVGKLSVNPQIDCKTFGAWISQETGSERFKRVCCVELLDYSDGSMLEKDFSAEIILKETFSTLKFAIEQASIRDIDTKKIILPILGAGSQGLELELIIPQLVNQITSILKLYDVEEVTFFEINKDRAELLKKYLSEAFDNRIETDVFISYSSRQSSIAYRIANLLKANGISFWMAPESIPSSKNYLEVIPNALSNTKTVVLALTPEAESSVWVQKEIATAMGAGKTVIPCQFLKFDLSDGFNFLLNGCQIFACYAKDDYENELIKIIKDNLTAI